MIIFNYITQMKRISKEIKNQYIILIYYQNIKNIKNEIINIKSKKCEFENELINLNIEEKYYFLFIYSYWNNLILNQLENIQNV